MVTCQFEYQINVFNCFSELFSPVSEETQFPGVIMMLYRVQESYHLHCRRAQIMVCGATPKQIVLVCMKESWADQ